MVVSKIEMGDFVGVGLDEGVDVLEGDRVGVWVDD